ncbi:uncharacterized protein LOC132851919 [Tachysurus vachellii]|uniref:uncharacterized protein LOC132851919 n=1 Tax=Tachysurus vachellii TaxID=175792 RepID=UPI00296ACD97|nr:uncharacterized protein LOC132851919 [Tachysurus vachellii]
MKGVHAAETRIGTALRTMHQSYHEARRQGARNLNPIPYQAGYMGHKIHMDQNEKLAMFGVTHVLAIDGFSKKNHIVERIWPEVISRVNYPLKTALLQLVDQEEIYMNDSLVRYCVSNLTGQLCQIGLTRLVESWNAHRIPGKGVPNDLAGCGCPKKIPQELLPHSVDAADLYSQQLGSSLTTHSTFGVDPFSTEQDKLRVENQFAEQYSDISDLFSRAVNNDLAPYKQALLCLITTTQHNVRKADCSI